MKKKLTIKLLIEYLNDTQKRVDAEYDKADNIGLRATDSEAPLYGSKLIDKIKKSIKRKFK